MNSFLLKHKGEVIGIVETRVKRHRAKKIQKQFGREWDFFANYDYAPNGRNLVMLEMQQYLLC